MFEMMQSQAFCKPNQKLLYLQIAADESLTILKT